MGNRLLRFSGDLFHCVRKTKAVFQSLIQKFCEGRVGLDVVGPNDLCSEFIVDIVNQAFQRFCCDFFADQWRAVMALRMLPNFDSGDRAVVSLFAGNIQFILDEWH